MQKSKVLNSFISRLLTMSFGKSLLLIVTFWTVALVTRYFTNGISFGFDYGVFQPDGSNYYFRTLTFLGYTNDAASRVVSDWYLVHGFKHNVIDPSTLLPENNPVWYLSAPRVIYPALSVPFVYLLGATGMLIIPALSLLGIMITINWIAWRYRSSVLGLLFNFALISSPTVSRWFIANITDGLLAFLIGLYPLIYLNKSRMSLKVQDALIISLILISSATRFSLPIWFCIGLLLLMTKEVRGSIVVFVTALAGSVPLLIYGVNSAILPGAESQSLLDKLIIFPVNSFKVSLVEVAQLVVLDKILLLILAVGLFAAFETRKVFSGRIAFFVLLGVAIIGFLNGTLGVNFRYQLPIIVFLFWAIAEWVNSKKLSEIPVSK